MDINECKNALKQLLADTDYAVLEDVLIDNKAEFKSVRAGIRAMLFSDETLESFVQAGLDPVDSFVIPDPIWTEAE